MPSYMLISLAGALALALSSLLGKMLLRYRICDAGLITWGQTLGGALIAAGLFVVSGRSFPVSQLWLVTFLAAVSLAGTWFLNRALQEGDASSVIPLMALKIPLTAVMAFFLLDENGSGRVWSAVACSSLAVLLFGSGNQRPAEGGHGRRQAFAVVLILLSSFFYASADLAAGKALADIDPVTLLLSVNIVCGPVALAMLARPHYRKYRISGLDILLLLILALLVLAGILWLYMAISLANGVIMPNIVFGVRGFFALIAGYLLNLTLRLPLERQAPAVYIRRALGAVLMFAALLLALGSA